MTASAAIPTDKRHLAGRRMAAADVSDSVKFEGDELPHIWMLRKYVWVSTGEAQEESSPIEFSVN